ncbi:hypothetical protein [Paraburkholderia bannensis]|uniref:hypothetical protein n=1 Tax=Paraburkholderia bannensis TaxID=765414 RepID=UPI00048997C4|nr:hypothetical protein [Paraburkholderia bannensis]
MSPREALPIIRTLADGIDPLTGDVLCDQSPFNQPDVIRALFAAAQGLEHLFDEPAARACTAKKAQNAGASGPPEEDERLVKAYDEGANVAALAAQHGPTKGAFSSRLVKLGRIER